MARYRKIDVRMWRDRRFLALSPPQPNGRDCWIYLLSNPATSNIPGVYHAYEEALARGLGWPLEAFRKAFAEAAALGLVKADWDAGLVLIPNAIKYDPPQSPNVVKGWIDTWDELPECPLKTDAYVCLKSYVDGLAEAFREAFAEACPKPNAEERETSAGTSLTPFPKGLPEGLAEGFAEALPEGLPKGSSTGGETPVEGAFANPEPEPEPDPEPEPEEEIVAPASLSRPPAGEPGPVRAGEVAAPPQELLRLEPAPLVADVLSRADEAVATLAAASNGRFVASRLKRGHAICAQRLIAAHPNASEWQLVGEWLSAGGEAWRTELDARSLGDFEAWLAHATKWRDAGRPSLQGRGARAPTAMGYGAAATFERSEDLTDEL